MTMELRPLRAGELLDRTFTLLRRHFLLFAGVAVLPTAGLVLFQIALIAGGAAWLAPRPGHPLSPALLANIALLMVAMPITIGVIAWTVSRIALGQPVTLRESFRSTAACMPSLVGASLLGFAAVAGAGGVVGLAIGVWIGAARGHVPVAVLIGIASLLALAAIVAFGWVGISLALIHPAIALERLGPIRGLQRSWRLCAGGRGRLFLIYVVYTVLIFVLQFLFIVPLTTVRVYLFWHGGVPAWMPMATQSASYLVTSLVIPVLAIGNTLEYINQRIRKEAFDLQVMMNSLEPAELESQ